MQAASLALCRRVLWNWPGLYAWLLAATSKPVLAIASYDANSALKLCLSFGRHGLSTSHFRTLALPGKVGFWSELTCFQPLYSANGTSFRLLSTDRKP